MNFTAYSDWCSRTAAPQYLHVARREQTTQREPRLVGRVLSKNSGNAVASETDTRRDTHALLFTLTTRAKVEKSAGKLVALAAASTKLKLSLRTHAPPLCFLGRASRAHAVRSSLQPAFTPSSPQLEQWHTKKLHSLKRPPMT